MSHAAAVMFCIFVTYRRLEATCCERVHGCVDTKRHVLFEATLRQKNTVRDIVRGVGLLQNPLHTLSATTDRHMHGHSLVHRFVCPWGPAPHMVSRSTMLLCALLLLSLLLFLRASTCNTNYFDRPLCPCCCAGGSHGPARGGKAQIITICAVVCVPHPAPVLGPGACGRAGRPST